MTDRGFTLVELLAATALTVVLMGAVLAVIADIGAAGAVQASRVGQVDQAQAVPTRAVVELLRQDIHQARQVETGDAVLTLIGHGGLNAERQWRHRPVRVTYQIEQIGNTPWLVRQQAALDMLSNQNLRRDLVCGGVSRFSVSSESADGERTTWRLRLWTAAQGECVCDELLTTREEPAQ